MNIIDKFYDYQKEAFNSTKQHDKGIIIMPTGTGKTFVQAGIIADDIRSNPGFRMYVVNAPRILLSFQLLEEVFKILVGEGIEARYMAVHSGGMDQNELDQFRSQTNIPYSTIESSTRPSDVNQMIKKAKKDNLPLIFFSTYNSAIRIEEGRSKDKIDIILNDEAHYLVQERFNLDFNEIQTKRKYFFTATTKETPSDEGFGMNNSDFYGERIYTMTPLDAIQRGKIVRPRVHIVEAGDGTLYNQDEIDKNLGKIVVNSFNQHSRLITSNQTPKMLIASRGVNDMKELIKSPEIQNLINQGVKFYAVASDKDVLNYINGERVNRKKFLELLKQDGSNPNQKLIVIHYDILTEGIDVPGLTGVLFLRNLGKSKFIQTFGRVARLDKQDRSRLESNEISPNDLKQMNKPYAWVIIPTITQSDKDKEDNLTSLITELRDFGFNPSEDIEPNDRGNGEGEDEENDIVPTRNTRRVVGEIIENYNYRVEEERIANLSWEESIKNLKETPEFDLVF